MLTAKSVLDKGVVKLVSTSGITVYAEVYPPISEWSLPDGVAYDPLSDTFLDGSRNVVGVEVGSVALPVRYKAISATIDDTVEVLSTGVNREALSGLVLHYSDEKKSSLSDAWGVGVNGAYYDIDRMETIPEVSPLIIRLSLRKKNDGGIQQ